MINRKMQAIASTTKNDPKKPLANTRQEAVLQYWLAHPDLKHTEICEHFNHAKSYIAKLQGQKDFKERYEYLKNKIYKTQTKNAIWSVEQLHIKLQDRLSKTKSDSVYVMGIGTLGKWHGLDKQTIDLNQKQDNHFTLEVIIKEKEETKDAKDTVDATS